MQPQKTNLNHNRISPKSNKKRNIYKDYWEQEMEIKKKRDTLIHDAKTRINTGFNEFEDWFSLLVIADNLNSFLNDFLDYCADLEIFKLSDVYRHFEKDFENKLKATVEVLNNIKKQIINS